MRDSWSGEVAMPDLKGWVEGRPVRRRRQGYPADRRLKKLFLQSFFFFRLITRPHSYGNWITTGSAREDGLCHVSLCAIHQRVNAMGPERKARAISPRREKDHFSWVWRRTLILWPIAIGEGARPTIMDAILFISLYSLSAEEVQVTGGTRCKLLYT